jgi:hypothetical protein
VAHSCSEWRGSDTAGNGVPQPGDPVPAAPKNTTRGTRELGRKAGRLQVRPARAAAAHARAAFSAFAARPARGVEWGAGRRAFCTPRRGEQRCSVARIVRSIFSPDIETPDDTVPILDTVRVVFVTHPPRPIDDNFVRKGFFGRERLRPSSTLSAAAYLTILKREGSGLLSRWTRFRRKGLPAGRLVSSTSPPRILTSAHVGRGRRTALLDGVRFRPHRFRTLRLPSRAVFACPRGILLKEGLDLVSQAFPLPVAASGPLAGCQEARKRAAGGYGPGGCRVTMGKVDRIRIDLAGLCCDGCNPGRDGTDAGTASTPGAGGTPGEGRSSTHRRDLVRDRSGPLRSQRPVRSPRGAKPWID